MTGEGVGRYWERERFVAEFWGTQLNAPADVTPKQLPQFVPSISPQRKRRISRVRCKRRRSCKSYLANDNLENLAKNKNTFAKKQVQLTYTTTCVFFFFDCLCKT